MHLVVSSDVQAGFVFARWWRSLRRALLLLDCGWWCLMCRNRIGCHIWGGGEGR
jgi:hypothetical protein